MRLRCGSGGIGRRASLRSWWPKGRRGSSPFFRTLFANSSSTKRESLQPDLSQHTAQAGQLHFGFQYFRLQFLFEFVAQLTRFFPQRFQSLLGGRVLAFQLRGSFFAWLIHPGPPRWKYSACSHANGKFAEPNALRDAQRTPSETFFSAQSALTPARGFFILEFLMRLRLAALPCRPPSRTSNR